MLKGKDIGDLVVGAHAGQNRVLKGFSQWDEHPREWEGEFDQVRLCFVEEIPQSAAAESVRLVPAWEFSGVFLREASGGGKSLLRMTYFVNAITGEITGQPFTVVVNAD